MGTLLRAFLRWVRFANFEALARRIRFANRVRFAIPLLCVLSGLSQSLSTITGQVKDASGAGIVGASVTIRNAETNAVRTLTTDGDGRYSASSLPAASYSVSAQKAGFETAFKNGIAIVVGQTAIEDLTLPLGKFSQVITVTEEPPVVSLSTEQTSGLVGEKQVKELPLNGRSYDELMTLNPGIVNYTSEKAGGTGTSNSAIGNMFSASGRRPQESIFLLNGIEYTGASEINLTPGGTSGQLLGVDAVREFNVVTDTYGAEYGKRPGAQVNIVTSSGTNQLHGTIYEFLRNSALDGRNFFDGPSIPPFERNEFGGALGGPVQRNATFFFGNYEGFRQRLGLSNVTLVPDNAARSGLLVGPSGKPVGLAPGVSELLSLWPVQNGPELGGGIAESFNNPLQRTQENFGTARIDHVFSSNDTLAAVYTVDDSGAHTPTVNPLSAITETLREQVISLSETHIFSPQVLNTVHFGFSRGAFYFGSQAPDVPSWVEGAPIGAVVIGGGTASNSATQISNAGTNVASNTVAVRNLFTYQDQVDINIGVHHLQAGAWVQRIQSNDNFAQAQYGQASFSSLTTFLQGTVSTFTAVPVPTALGWRSVEGAGYVQDTLKLTSKLEVKLGFRFESTNGWNETHGRASNYLFGPGGVIETEPRIATSVFTKNRAKFLPEPRVGLAWSPFGNNNTVIHAGFGIYNALLDNLSYRLDQNAPFNTTLSLKNLPVSSIHILPGQQLPSGGSISPGGVQPDMYTPSVVTYTLKIEQKIAPHTALTVGYIGSHGYHEILSLDANQPHPTVCPAVSCPASLQPGTVYYAPGSPLATPHLANTTSWFSEGVSSYNALQVDVNRRFANGLQVRGAYTFSKSLDDGGTLNNSVGNNTPAFVMFPLNPKLDYGLSPFDVRHLAVINGSYELPVGHGKPFLNEARGWMNKLVSGWTLGGIVTVQSGLPFTPQLGFNPTNNGDTRNPIRPSWNPAFTGSVIQGGLNQYFNPNAFVVPPNGTYGNVGRDILTGPGLATLDASLLKNFTWGERLKLQFRSEFFNVLNHANFGTPNPIVFTSSSGGPTPTAGLINNTSTTSRQIQFGLKLLW